MNNENKYWLSLEDLSGDKNFKKTIKDEFLSSLPSIDDIKSSRREFLQIMGAGLALTTTACARRASEKIVPYVNRPEDIIPGEANHYASSYYDGGEGFSILVKTREARPIKIEPNDEADLLNARGLSPRAHAHILSLYDPERIKNPKQNLFDENKINRETVNISYKELDKTLLNSFKKGKVALFTSRLPSPSVQKLMKSFKKVFGVKHYVWDPISMEDVVEGQKLSYGSSYVPSYNISKAQFILSLNCDFLGTYLSPTDFQKQFAATRKPNSNMSRLVVLESLMTLTGSNADQRHRISASDQMPVLTSLAKALHKKSYIYLDAKALKIVNSYKSTWPQLQIPQSKIEEWAQLLGKNKSRSLIMAGGLRSQTKDAKQIQILVNFLNSALKNDGKTINHSQSFNYEFGSYSQIQKLIRDLNKGSVKTVIIHKINPLYSYPEKDKLLAALKKADTIVYTGDRVDETGFHVDYIVPDNHDLEKWSDWEFKKSVFTIGQPTIQPLYNTRAFEDSLLAWIRLSDSKAETATSFYQYLKNFWDGKKGPLFWDTFLKVGVTGSKVAAVTAGRVFRLSAWDSIKNYKAYNKQYELTLYETSGLKNGDLGNVAWLQEFPDPVTKICWDNYVCVSPRTAIKESLKEGEVLEISCGKNKLKAPVHIQPGQDDYTLALAIGYGHTHFGMIANQAGVNAYPLAQGNQFSGLKASFSKTGEFKSLANVQAHHSMEGRDIVLETTLAEFKKDASSGMNKHHKIPSLWSKHKYTGHKWGMVIDLNSCNGCGTCMIACQSENNIPTVGKKYVLEGREMNWITVDRYYKGTAEEPSAVHQPRVCMHCDNAPCETVCPVMATVHSDEGTNDMIYNRCVGTRYCSNNCPYKVRRFNWFNYTKKIEEPLNLALNPDVTVRSRGVMEKCTFCIQRVQTGKATAKKQDREVKDGDIQTACQQSCPADAIVFGDLNDPASRVAKAFNTQNSYALLDDMLNTKPAVKYHTKVRNQDLAMHVGTGHAGAGVLPNNKSNDMHSPDKSGSENSSEPSHSKDKGHH